MVKSVPRFDIFTVHCGFNIPIVFYLAFILNNEIIHSQHSRLVGLGLTGSY